jgi:transketolase
MAIAAQWQAAHFNRPGLELFDYDVYALAGDGCMMEGISSEAASLAGHLQLSNLCWIYDSNRITIEGSTSLAFSEDVAARFLAHGWNVTRVSDANDLEALSAAFGLFRAERNRPTLVIVESHIDYGAPHRQDTSAAHGEPLGEEEIRKTKRGYGWPQDARFLVPDGVYAHFSDGVGARGRRARDEWMARYERYAARYPDLADELVRMQRRELPDGWDELIPTFEPDAAGIGGRESSGVVLNALAARVPWLIGGAADLAPSTKTRLASDGVGDFSARDRAGRNLHFGIREHAMHAIMNGLSLSKLRPFGAQFLIFSDYARTPIRLSALMDLPVVHVFTHDSIGVGEDGPTHQPIEHLASLRATPGLIDLRPGDANEVAEAWRVIARLQHEPVALVLSRQAMPTLDRAVYAPAEGVARGAYVLAGGDERQPEVILIATGSELGLGVQAYEELVAEGIAARLVSMPSWALFERQTCDYRDAVLPPSVAARVAIEQASTFGWERYVGLTGTVVGMRTFGASAPLKELQTKFGFTPDAVVAEAKAQLRIAVPG